MGQESTQPPLTRVSHYDLLGEIGRGGMGVVYRAYDREARRVVALKALHGTHPEDLYRLKSEFRALAGVVHPHLVRFHDLTVEGERAFLAMELVEGGRGIVEYLRSPAKRGALRETFRQLASALQALHGAGWLHRDLKPSNVLIDAAGRLVLLDFGLIRALGAEARERTQLGTIAGTLAYMSPEQALGQPLNAASDWYGFGVLLYECLTGQSPFADVPVVSLLDRTRLEIPPANAIAPECPPELGRLVSLLLAVDASQRPDATAVLSVLGEREPDSARTPDRAAFVGRAAELALLRAAWSSNRKVAAVAAIEGASGIGKTALVERFAGELQENGALVLRGRCYPHELVAFEALDGVVDDLSRFLSSLTRERVDALLPRDVLALRRLFPVLGRVLPDSPGGAEDQAEPHELRRRGFAALRELLGRLADRRPVAIWVDDLQWADADSGPLLRELLRPPDAPPILWLLSFRAEDRDRSPLLSALPKLLESIEPEHRHAILLQPLTGLESEELARRLGGPRTDAGMASALAKEARGSPFLLTELLRREPSRAAAADGLPNLDALVAGRLRGLPTPASHVLELLTVAAGPLDRRLALDLAGDPDANLEALLEAAHLIRAAAGEGANRLELYHDQIREVVERRLTPERRRACHAELAEAFERAGSRNSALLFPHYAGAGNAAAAARHAVLAGEQAARQLAFDQAARLFGAALEQDAAAIDAPRTMALLAEALANAGRGRQAAAAYEAAAAKTAGLAAEALHQQAAEQYLVCGAFEEGKQVLAPVLSRYGVRYPATGGEALRGTLLRLPQLLWRYARPSRTAGPSEALVLRIDACNRAGRGLLLADPPRAMYFAVLSLLHALGSPDKYRLGRALCTVGGLLIPLRVPGAGALARSMFSRAERLTLELGDPRLTGMVSIASAQVEFVAGRFAAMLDRCDQGARLLAENCRGVRWDCVVAQTASLRALEELGRVDELLRRLPGLIEEAIALDDLSAEVTFRLYAAFWKISRGAVDQARREADDLSMRWRREGVQVQNLYELRIQACCDVYEGGVASAWERVQTAWPGLESSGLLTHRMLLSDALQLRARTALAAADGVGIDLSGEIERAARALEGMRRPDSGAAAGLLRASLAARRGERGVALALLERAQAEYAASEMSLYVAYTQARRGELLGGEPGAVLSRAARAVLADAGIVDPARWLELHAPGFSAADAA